MKFQHFRIENPIIAFSGLVSNIWALAFQSLIDKLNGLFTDNNEFKIKVYAQDAQPTLTENNVIALWKDTNDSNRMYLVFRRGTSDQVKVELT